MTVSAQNVLESVVKNNEEQTKKVEEIDKKHQDYILNLEHVIHHTNSETKRYFDARMTGLEKKILGTDEKLGIEIQIHEMEKNINCLFTSLKGVETKLMGNPFQPLKPHKCPVCDGKGREYIDPASLLSGFESMFGQKDERGISFSVCKPCEGKGIVWG